MSRTVSIATMLIQIQGLGFADTTDWEKRFITSVWAKTNDGKATTVLSEKQVETIESIWQRHFA